MINIFKVTYQEWKSKTMIERIPEPMVMDENEQALAYHNESLWGGAMDSIHLFHMYNISKLIRPHDKVMDLACGTGDLLIKLAVKYSEVNFFGVDLSEQMLNHARKTAQSLKLNNIEFIKYDICDLSDNFDKKIDFVLSTGVLHQMPDSSFLTRIAHSINKVIKPNGKIYISDFLRLSSKDSIDLFLKDRNDVDPKLFVDYKNSLYAAFSKEDIIKYFFNHLTVPQIELKQSRFFDFVFTISSQQKNRIAERKNIFSLPFRKISWRGFSEFFILKILVSKKVAG